MKTTCTAGRQGRQAPTNLLDDEELVDADGEDDLQGAERRDLGEGREPVGHVFEGDVVLEGQHAGEAVVLLGEVARHREPCATTTTTTATIHRARAVTSKSNYILGIAAAVASKTRAAKQAPPNQRQQQSKGHPGTRTIRCSSGAGKA